MGVLATDFGNQLAGIGLTQDADDFFGVVFLLLHPGFLRMG